MSKKKTSLPTTTTKVTSPKGDALVPIFIRLPPEHIVSLKFIFETYEGIGVVRTLDAVTGDAVLLALEDTAQTAREILVSIADQLSLELTPPPASLEGDWLLSEEML